MAIDRTQYNALADDAGNGTSGTVWDKNQIKIVILDPIDQNGLISDNTYNDGSSHSLGAVHTVSGRITIAYGNNVIVIPFFPNGGAGVAHKWTYLDPDTGWVNNSNGSFSFSDAAGTNTFSVTFDGSSGASSIQRTAGSTAYRVMLQSDPRPA